MAEDLEKPYRFWIWSLASMIFPFCIILFPENINLSSRPELSTPLTSLRRLAEGYWLKQASMSPYSGSMYHGSPLLLSILGPLTIQRIEGKWNHHLCSLVFVVSDILSAVLLRATCHQLQKAYNLNLRRLGVLKLFNKKFSLVEILLLLCTCGILSQYFLVLAYQLLQLKIWLSLCLFMEQLLDEFLWLHLG